MSLHEYERSRKLFEADEPFYGLIMAAMRKADLNNIERLKRAFPEVFHELQTRYMSPGGLLPDELAARRNAHGQLVNDPELHELAPVWKKEKR